MAPARWTSFNFIVILGNSGFAGRPVQFDSSGNGPIRERVVRAVFPHPGPLPQGEGTARIAQWKAEVSGLFSVRRKVHPLPEGEGWGEGKQTPARRNGNVFDLSCSRCRKAIRP